MIKTIKSGIKIINDETDTYYDNLKMLPDEFLFLVVGRVGAGKSVLVKNLIFSE